MAFAPITIDFYENTTGQPVILHGIMKLNPGARIINSRIGGPFYVNRHTQIGPEASVGRYFGMNADGYIARATVGSYCAFGARTSINPFNHPTDWLSISEFQYQPQSFDWVEEYRDFVRLERTPDMFRHSTIGNDVWTGHNVNVMAGINVGDGAVIAAGSVVTRDVPPYAIVAGTPAKILRYRFSEAIIERLLAVRWWDFELPQLSGLNFRDVTGILPRLEEMRAADDEAGRGAAAGRPAK